MTAAAQTLPFGVGVVKDPRSGERLEVDGRTGRPVRCVACGALWASFGVGYFPRAVPPRLGRWYCRDHAPATMFAKS